MLKTAEKRFFISISFFIRPSKTGRIVGSPATSGGGGAAASSPLSGELKILWVDRSHQGGSAVHMNRNSCLLNFWVIAIYLFSYLNFVRSISSKLY